MVEDFSKLHRDDEKYQINAMELSAVIYGITQLLLWGVHDRTVNVVVDNMATATWVRSAMDDSLLSITGIYKPLVISKINLLKAMCRDANMLLAVTLVESQKNLADVLTRVRELPKTIRRQVLGAVAQRDEGESGLLWSRNPFAETEKMVSQTEFDADRFALQLHVEMGHSGKVTMRESVRRYFPEIWKNHLAMVDDAIRAMLERCRVCLQKRRVYLPKGHGGRSVPDDLRAREMVEVDCVKMNGNGGFITIIDVRSRHVDVTLLDGPPKAEYVVRALKFYVGRYGLPRLMRSDQGREFVNQWVAEWCRTNAVVHQLSPARHPRNMGVVERVHRSLLSLVRGGDMTKTWSERLADAVNVYNHRPHSHLGYATPMQIFNGVVAPPCVEIGREQGISRMVDLAAGQAALSYCEKPKDRWPYDEVVVTRVLGENVFEVRKVDTGRLSIVNSHLLIALEDDSGGEDVSDVVAETFGRFETQVEDVEMELVMGNVCSAELMKEEREAMTGRDVDEDADDQDADEDGDEQDADEDGDEQDAVEDGEEDADAEERVSRDVGEDGCRRGTRNRRPPMRLIEED